MNPAVRLPCHHVLNPRFKPMTVTMDGDTRRVHAPPGGLVMDLGGYVSALPKSTLKYYI